MSAVANLNERSPLENDGSSSDKEIPHILRDCKFYDITDFTTHRTSDTGRNRNKPALLVALGGAGLEIA